ncbi:CAAX geranylgeranyltransferase alpha subunit [Sporothrix stenoceras]|uniref:Protein farnesyltransferase/geranylgeranyltransferase type-1 subunit alpha n=1 Tax=Sporothrix stenoceras TaxID=5173 RepID=A0ABR3Z3G1_9PEZI
MPPKGKAAPKAKETSASSSSTPTPQPPKTVDERSQERYYQGRPYARVADSAGISALSPADRTAWASAQLLASTARNNGRSALSNKAQKELWRHVNEASLPLRTLPSPSSSSSTWGRDKSGRPVGDYSFDEFRLRTEKRVRLTALEVAHYAFLAKRGEDAAKITPDDIQLERQRRADIAVLRMELYGQRTGGAYAQDPDWDDVVPIALDEPEGALAAIAYPEAYAEAISYLRAVMAKPEYSTRCLRLTEHVISLNPAHYTVWLYRFSIVNALQLPVEAETEWLNGVALQNLKNYQIWHHRYLLAEYYYPQIASNADAVTKFARSEMAFLATILSEDTKNYHVWSYRQYLVRKLGYWVDDERKSMEAFIRQDVRNNSAWSHRFFLVFSDPNNSSNISQADKDNNKEPTKSLEASIGELNISHDPEVPAAIVDREIAYAQEQILKAPQNESPWNYLRGVLTKGGRPLASVDEFAQQFVTGVGSGDNESGEEVKSTHAMDFLASVYEEKGDKAQAAVYLQRLAEKWDPIRAGYWQYRKQQLGQ